MKPSIPGTAGGVFLAVILSLAGFAQGAHDLWAATALCATALLLLAASLFRAAWARGDGGLPLGSALPLALIGGAMWLSWRQSVNTGDSLLGLMDWACVLVMFLVSMRIFKEHSAADAFLAAMVPVLTAQAVIMFAQRLVVPDFFNHQSPGTFPNAHGAVGFGLPWIPALALKAWGRKGTPPWLRCFWGAGLVSAMSFIPLAECVSGLILLILCAPFLAGPGPVLRWVARHRARAIQGAFAGVMVIGWLFWKKFRYSHYLTGLPMHTGDPLMRLSWWISGWKIFLSRPWLGVGPDCFGIAYPGFRNPAAELNIRFSHSLLTNLLAETGVIGTASVMAFGAWWGRLARSQMVTSQERWPFVLGSILFLLFAAVNTTFEFLAVRIGIALCMAIAVAPGPGPAWVPRKSTAIVAAGLAFCSLPWIFQPLMASRLIVEGEAALQGRNLDASQNAFSAAAGLDPRHFEPERGLARVHHARYAAARDPASLQSAILHQRRAVERNPLAATLWLDLGIYLAESGRPAEAWSAVERAESLDKGRPSWKAEVEALRARMRSKASP